MTARGIGRLALVLYGLGLVAFGVLFLFVPRALTWMVDTSMPSAVSIMDIRAVYGGMLIGVGVFWMYCARWETLLRPGLISLALTHGGLVIGRTLGLSDGRPNALITALYATRDHRRRRRGGNSPLDARWSHACD